MSKDYLPLRIDPFRFADHESQLHGSLLISNLPRFSPLLSNDSGEVKINIQLGVDEEGIRFLQGSLQTQVILQCQRCMESFKYEIMDDFMLGIVETEEQVALLPPRYDPLVVKGSELAIQDIIEDELIVSLPIVPMHEIKDCKVSLPLVSESAPLQETEKDNPFKVIELLRTKRSK